MATLISARQAIITNKRWDKLFARTACLMMAFVLLVVAMLIGCIAWKGMARIDFDFLMSFASRRPEKAGILSAWVGSLLIMIVTAISAIPTGIAAAIYLEEYAPRNRLTNFIEISITNLAGVPSIVFGLMALGLFVYRAGLGQSILTAGLTLGLLVLPIIIVTTRESLRSIPSSIREAAYAMGASKWQTITHHVLPYSTGGILTGVIIALSRAIGETAPLVTIGALAFIAFLPPAPFTSEAPYISFEWLQSPFTVMPIQMFNWVSRPQEEFQVNAAAGGLILIIMTLLMNAAAIIIRHRFRNRIKW